MSEWFELEYENDKASPAIGVKNIIVASLFFFSFGFFSFFLYYFFLKILLIKKMPTAKLWYFSALCRIQRMNVIK
ncbi:hypothetical protein CVS40_8226 [Lucilia cuprina]|nr:hypothetical protein CVS40_8226 [Lucilia cuprina]